MEAPDKSPERVGPKTGPGFTTVSSILEASDCALIKSHAACSAKVLLFAYAETFFAYTLVQDSESIWIELSALPNIETIVEVKTTL